MTFEDPEVYPGSKEAMHSMVRDLEHHKIDQISSLVSKGIAKHQQVTLTQKTSTAFDKGSESISSWQLSLEYILDKSMVDLAKLFSLIEENSINLRIADWGVSPTTLEDVFVNVVEADLAANEAQGK